MDKALIFKALADATKRVGAIGKSKKAQGAGVAYNFRGIDDVLNEINPIFSDVGVFIMPEVLSLDRSTFQTKNGANMFSVTATMRYTFYASDGSSVACSVAGEAMDTGDKATSKAMSIALKYALFQVLTIPVEDKDGNIDPDHTVHEPVKPAKNQDAPRRQYSQSSGGSGGATLNQINAIKRMLPKHEPAIDPVQVLEMFNVQSFDGLSKAQASEIITALNKSFDTGEPWIDDNTSTGFPSGPSGIDDVPF